MVNQALVSYLVEGRRRGFEVSFLKQKLYERGFSETEIDEASALLSPISAEKRTFAVTEKPTVPEKLSILRKLYFSWVKPHAVFEKTETEKITSTFLFHELALLISLVTVSLVSVILIQTIAFPLAAPLALVLSPFTTSVVGGIMGVVAFTALILVPLLTFFFAGIIHLFVILLKGDGHYRGTYRSLVYGTVPYTLALPICLVFALVSPLGQWLGGIIAGALAIWSLITTTKALASYHRFSQGKGFMACVLGGIFFALVTSATILGIALVGPSLVLR